LVQSLEQPRAIKRIIEKSFEYDQVEVFGFTRAIHEVNNYAILKDYKNITLTVVGSMSNNEYSTRIGNYYKLLRLVYSKNRFNHKNIYVFGLDMRILSVLIINSKVDYEISDIVWLYKSSYQKAIAKTIDTFLAKFSRKVIFTSKGFYDAHYTKFVKPNNAIIKENKFKTYDKVSPIENIIQDKIRIAYIGAFRYVDIFRNLIDFVKTNEKFVLNFYGDGPVEIVSEMKNNAADNMNIYFHGAFKNPDDLEKIYNENNLNFVVYDNRSQNERVAMPNKFYESGFFNIPIVAANETYVGQRVLDQGLGWTCGISFEEISKFLTELQIKDIVQTHENIKKLDKSSFEA
jgi:hypothetical protein